MGKKIIIQGADFSANGIKYNIVTGFRLGFYNDQGGFSAQGEQGFQGWVATNPITVSTGDVVTVSLQAHTRFRIFNNGQVSQTAILTPGNHTINVTAGGQIGFNFATSSGANPAPPFPPATEAQYSASVAIF